MGWPFREDYKPGMSLRAISADDLGSAMRIWNDLTGENVTIVKTPTGKGWKLIVPLDTTCFQTITTGERTRIQTKGTTATGTIGATTIITVENGLVKYIGPLT